MKLTAVFLFALTINVSANGYSQDITLKLSNTSLEKVFNEIRKQTGYLFFYKTDLLKDIPTVKIKVKNASIEEAMKACLIDLPLTYFIIDKTIVLNAKQTSVVEKIKEEIVAPDIDITGKIVSDAGVPLVGASIKLKGSSIGTSTDENGKFILSVPATGSVLEFSFVGYESIELTIKSNESLNVILKQKNTKVEEVVVIGYGSAKKKDLTGAVASIKGDDLKSVTAADASSLLQGKAAGVVVQNSGGAPGQAPAIVIRGSGTFGNDQPLYVIDGMIASSMAFVNANDIASIDVLKDASAAAIYGSRAANGVVLVTTKTGTTGVVKISFNAKYGTQSPTHTLKFVNARQYADWNNLAHDNDGTPRGPLNDNLFNPNINTDWQGLYLNPAPLGDYNMSISGGGQNSKFFISGQYFDQKGVVVDSRFKRYSLRANSSFNKGKFKFTQSLAVSRSLNNPNTYFGRERDGVPYMPVYDSTKLGGFAGLDPGAVGVPRIINWYGRGILNDNLFTTDQALGNVGLEYEIIKGLKYKLNLGMDYSVFHSYDYTPAFYMSSSQEASQNVSILNEGFTRSLTTLVEHTLNYNRSFGKHHIDVLAGYTSQTGNARSVGATADTYAASFLRVVNAASNRLASGSLQEAALQSVLGRVSYNFESKYLFTATLRRDGSSKFLYPKNTYGNYPSFSVGWVPTEENFFPKNSIINNLKIRGSYGTLGSQNIPNYITSTTLNINTSYYFAGGVQNGVGLTNFSNPEIRWESSRTTDIGTDISLLNNKIVITADYFDRRSFDILASIPIPIYGGAGGSLTKNAASVSNKGFEFALTYNHAAQNKNGIKYSFTGVFTTIKNNLTALGNGVSPITGGGYTQEGLTATRSDVGHPIGSFWGYKVLGIYQTQDEITRDGVTDAKPGDFRFGADPTWLGSPFPTFDYGLNFNASYKNFDFTMFWQGVSGNKLWNAKRAWQYTFDYGSGKVTDVLRAWTPQNTNTDIPRPSMNSLRNKKSSSFYVEDGSYLRLKNISIGYNFSDAFLKKMKITNARFYLSGQNLLTFTKYKGYDPEVGRGSLTDLFSVGVDIAAYPQSKLISAGINLTF